MRVLLFLMVFLYLGCTPEKTVSKPPVPVKPIAPKLFIWPELNSTPFQSLKTIAGEDFPEFKDGIGSNAAFSYPWDIVVNSKGDLFIADRFNHRIRKVKTDGEVTTFAGGGNPDHKDGLASFFNRPSGLAIDAKDNIYVADDANHVIRKITPSGFVTTIAGVPGQSGWQDGPAHQSLFKSPMGVFIDSKGVIYIADTRNHRIRTLSPDGQVTTMAGSGKAGLLNGKGLQAQFNSPRGVVVNSDGIVYVTDSFNHAIRKIDNQSVSLFSGTGKKGYLNGSRQEAQFSEPVGLDIDKIGNLYIADTLNHRIRKLSSRGEVTTLAGSGIPEFNNGDPLKAGLASPRGFAISSPHSIFIADTNNQRIRILE